VWRAVNDEPGVRPEVRERILEVAGQLGYRRNATARALVTGKTGIISLWVPVMSSEFSGRVLAAMDKLAAANGYRLHVQAINTRRHEPLHNLLEWPVDGLILFDAEGFGESIAAFRHTPGERTLPVVSLGLYVDAVFPCVTCDLEEAMARAVAHLIARGRCKPAFLAPPYFLGDDQARVRGYKKGMAAAGLEPLLLSTDSDPPANRQLTHRDRSRRAVIAHWKSNPKAFDSLVCFSDDQAIGAYRGLRDLGLRVPEDVALTGCDDNDSAKYLDCPLTTLHIPVGEISRRGWTMLKNSMEAPDTPIERVVLPVDLVVRDSSG
jgi:LacI family transcriptional regulator